jgi:DNA-binding MurR/RpiR family transcriptional regulator
VHITISIKISDERMSKSSKKDNVLSQIKTNLNNFSKTEKRIAEFVGVNKEDIAFYSIQDLSKKLGIGRASIIRFTNKLGFDGYASFKNEIISELKNNIAPLENFKIQLDESKTDNFSINKIAKNEVSNINYTLNHLDSKSLEQSIELIRNARIIYVAGMGVSTYLSGITSYLLRRIGYNAFHLNESGLTFIEQIINISKKDLLIVFSFPQYSEETIETTQFAQKQKAKIISITNSITAPIVELANSNLLVKTDSKNFSNSLSPILVMIYGLINEVVITDKKRSIKALDKVIATRH